MRRTRLRTENASLARASGKVSRALERVASAAEPVWAVLWVLAIVALGVGVVAAENGTKFESVLTNVFASVLVAPLIIFFVEWGIDRRVREREAARIAPRSARIVAAAAAEIAFILNRIFLPDPSLLGSVELEWLEDGEVTQFLTTRWATHAEPVHSGIHAVNWTTLRSTVAGIEERHKTLVDVTVLGLEALPPDAHASLMDAVDAIRTAIDRWKAGIYIVDNRSGDDREAMEKVFAKHVAKELVKLVDALVLANQRLNPGVRTHQR